MYKDDLLIYFGYSEDRKYSNDNNAIKKISDLLGCTVQAVYGWPEIIPEKWALILDRELRKPHIRQRHALKRTNRPELLPEHYAQNYLKNGHESRHIGSYLRDVSDVLLRG